MKRSTRLVMTGMTLLFDIGVILLCIHRPAVAPALKVIFPVLPWLVLGACLVPWPRARASTQGWVGIGVLVLSFALIAGILFSL